MGFGRFIESNKDKIIELMRDFVNSKIDGESFGAAISEYRRRAMEEDEKQMNSWPRRLDLELTDAYTRGDLTKEQYSKKWQELYGHYDPKWVDIFNGIYAETDRFEPDENVRNESRNHPILWNAEYYIDEETFREQIKKYLDMVESR
jgi:hypothetical protein